jgi:hypothetical protein
MPKNQMNTFTVVFHGPEIIIAARRDEKLINVATLPAEKDAQAAAGFIVEHLRDQAPVLLWNDIAGTAAGVHAILSSKLYKEIQSHLYSPGQEATAPAPGNVLYANFASQILHQTYLKLSQQQLALVHERAAAELEMCKFDYNVEGKLAFSGEAGPYAYAVALAQMKVDRRVPKDPNRSREYNPTDPKNYQR